MILLVGQKTVVDFEPPAYEGEGELQDTVTVGNPQVLGVSRAGAGRFEVEAKAPGWGDLTIEWKVIGGPILLAEGQKIRVLREEDTLAPTQPQAVQK